MKVSFIIPLYNCLPLTQTMLASLRATLPPGLEAEIILVDDGSTDGTRDWLAGFCQPVVSLSNPPIQSSAPCRTILNDRNLGFAAACNHGAATATGECLFFLNNDLILLPRWLEPMLTVFERFPAAGLVGNVQLNAATGAVDHTGVYFNHQGKPAHRTDLSVTARWFGWPAYRELDALTGACFGIRAAQWRQLGGFDEGFVNGCEDIDLCLRATTAGLRHYVALGSVVRHHISSSAGRKQRDEQNSHRLMSRWRTAIQPRIIRECSRICLAAAWDDPRYYPDQNLARDAFLYLARILPVPTARLHAAAAAALNLELARWAHLLEGAPARAPRAVAWQLFPVERPEPDVL